MRTEDEVSENEFDGDFDCDAIDAEIKALDEDLARFDETFEREAREMQRFIEADNLKQKEIVCELAAMERELETIERERARAVREGELERLKVHAFNAGLVTGPLHALDASSHLGDGVSFLVALKAIYENLTVYQDGLLDGDDDKQFFETLAQEMQEDIWLADQEEIEQLPDLSSGRVVVLSTGWTSHSVAIAFFQCHGETYLAYANRGEGCNGRPGIHVYRVGNPEALNNPGFLAKVHVKRATKAYMTDHAAKGRGLGFDLQLEAVAYLPESKQTGPRCSVLHANASIKLRLMVACLHQIAARRHKPSLGLTLGRPDFIEAIALAKLLYKPYRYFSRAHSTLALERGLSAVECEMESTSKYESAKSNHQRLFVDLGHYVARRSLKRARIGWLPTVWHSQMKGVVDRRVSDVSRHTFDGTLRPDRTC